MAGRSRIRHWCRGYIRSWCTAGPGIRFSIMIYRIAGYDKILKKYNHTTFIDSDKNYVMIARDHLVS